MNRRRVQPSLCTLGHGVSVTARPRFWLGDRIWHAAGNGLGLRATAASGVAVRDVASARRDWIIRGRVRTSDDRQTENADDLADECQAEGDDPVAALRHGDYPRPERPAVWSGRIVTGRMRSVDTRQRATLSLPEIRFRQLTRKLPRGFEVAPDLLSRERRSHHLHRHEAFLENRVVKGPVGHFS